MEPDSDDLGAKSCTPIDPLNVNELAEEEESDFEAHVLETSATYAVLPGISQPDFVAAHGGAKTDSVEGKSCSPNDPPEEESEQRIPESFGIGDVADPAAAAAEEDAFWGSDDTVLYPPELPEARPSSLEPPVLAKRSRTAPTTQSLSPTRRTTRVRNRSASSGLADVGTPRKRHGEDVPSPSPRRPRPAPTAESVLARKITEQRGEIEQMAEILKAAESAVEAADHRAAQAANVAAHEANEAMASASTTVIKQLRKRLEAADSQTTVRQQAEAKLRGELEAVQSSARRSSAELAAVRTAAETQHQEVLIAEASAEQKYSSLLSECREKAGGASTVGYSQPPACVACPVKDHQINEARKMAARQQQELLEAQTARQTAETRCEHLVAEVASTGDQLIETAAKAKDMTSQLHSSEQYMVQQQTKHEADAERFRVMELKLKQAQDQLLNQSSVATTQSAEIERLVEALGIAKDQLRSRDAPDRELADVKTRMKLYRDERNGLQESSSRSGCRTPTWRPS